MVKYREGSQEEWDSIPPPSKRKVDELDAQMPLLEQGQILVVEAETESELRGKRLAIGRRAKARGCEVELRTQDMTVYARRKDTPTSPPPDAEPVKKRGRKRQAVSEDTPVLPDPETSPD